MVYLQADTELGELARIHTSVYIDEIIVNTHLTSTMDPGISSVRRVSSFLSIPGPSATFLLRQHNNDIDDILRNYLPNMALVSEGLDADDSLGDTAKAVAAEISALKSKKNRKTKDRQRLRLLINHARKRGWAVEDTDSNFCVLSGDAVLEIAGGNALWLTNEEPEEWDFKLPRLPSPKSLESQGGDELHLEKVLGAIQAGEDFHRVRKYLTCHSLETVQRYVDAEIARFPAIFYIVETRNLDLIRLWAKFGADMNAVGHCTKVPLLAFAVALGGSFQKESTDIVATLLSLGASPTCIPLGFFIPYTRDLSDSGEYEMAATNEEQDHIVCCAAMQKMLASRLNLRQRYYLNVAYYETSTGKRAKQIAERRDVDGLLGLQYTLIGQQVGSKLLKRKLIR